MFYHLHFNIEALLRLPYEQFKREYEGVFLRNGELLSGLAALLALQDLYYQGQRLIALEVCNNFNQETGCQGHEETEQELLLSMEAQ